MFAKWSARGEECEIPSHSSPTKHGENKSKNETRFSAGCVRPKALVAVCTAHDNENKTARLGMRVWMQRLKHFSLAARCLWCSVSSHSYLVLLAHGFTASAFSQIIRPLLVTACCCWLLTSRGTTSCHFLRATHSHNPWYSLLVLPHWCPLILLLLFAHQIFFQLLSLLPSTVDHPRQCHKLVLLCPLFTFEFDNATFVGSGHKPSFFSARCIAPRSTPSNTCPWILSLIQCTLVDFV